MQLISCLFVSNCCVFRDLILSRISPSLLSNVTTLSTRFGYQFNVFLDGLVMTGCLSLSGLRVNSLSASSDRVLTNIGSSTMSRLISDSW